MADIASQSWALKDDWGYGYRPVSPGSPRYTVSKSIVDNGNGTATVSLTCTITTNAGYIYPNYILYLNLNMAGVVNQATFKPQTTYWYSGNTYSATVSVTIPLDGTTTRSANLWVTGTAGTAFTFSSNTQGGDSITGIPLGYQTPTFTAFSNFNSNASSIAVTITERTASLTNTAELLVNGVSIKTWSFNDSITSLALTATEHTKIHNALPNSTSGTATLIVRAYNGASLVGTVERSATVSIPSSIAPSFSSLTASEQNNIVSTNIGAFVRYQSNIRFSINSPVAGQGASISSYLISFNGRTWSSQTADTGANDFYGTFTATGKVTDSRGRTATKTLSVTILDYLRPRLTNVSIDRATGTGGTVAADGIYLKVNRTIAINQLTVGGVNKNSMTLKVETKPITGSTWTQVYSYTYPASTTTHTGFTVPSTTYSSESSFNVRVTLTDKLNQSVVWVGVLGTASFPMIWGINNVGINKVPERGALDVGGDIFTTSWYASDTAEVPKLYTAPYGTLSSPAWYRLMTVKFTTDSTARGASGIWMDITLIRTYSNTNNEVWDFSICYAYNNAQLIVKNNNVNTKAFSKVRMVYDPAKLEWYLDVYYTLAIVNYAKAFIRVEGGSPSYTVTTHAFANTPPLPAGYVVMLDHPLETVWVLASGGYKAVRFPNGYQLITWRTSLSTAITQASGVIYFSNSSLPRTNWGWAFTELWTSSVLVQGAGQVVWYGVPWGANQTISPEVYVYKGSSDSTVRSYTVEITAHGRWY